jgi:hypothetical protein
MQHPLGLGTLGLVTSFTVFGLAACTGAVRDDTAALATPLDSPAERDLCARVLAVTSRGRGALGPATGPLAPVADVIAERSAATDGGTDTLRLLFTRRVGFEGAAALGVALQNLDDVTVSFRLPGNPVRRFTCDAQSAVVVFEAGPLCDPGGGSVPEGTSISPGLPYTGNVRLDELRDDRVRGSFDLDGPAPLRGTFEAPIQHESIEEMLERIEGPGARGCCANR